MSLSGVMDPGIKMKMIVHDEGTTRSSSKKKRQRLSALEEKVRRLSQQYHL